MIINIISTAASPGGLLMKSSNLPLIIILLILPVLIISCPEPVRKDFYLSVQDIYFDLEENEYNPENEGQAAWPYSYHPMLHAAWIFKGDEYAHSSIEEEFRRGNDKFWQLNSEIERQIAIGNETLDTEALFGLIVDDVVRNYTVDYYENENIAPLNAYTRAFCELSGIDSETGSFPEVRSVVSQLLVLLGQLYTDRPDLCEIPKVAVEADDDSRWRDWLQRCLASTEMSCREVIKWDLQLEKLQDLVPDEPFWDGSLTHAYTLRSLQLGESNSLEGLMELLDDNREDEIISGFESWIYWNLAYTVHSGNGLTPYSDDEVGRIGSFLFTGLVEGGLGENEKAWVIADALGRAPSVYYAEILFTIIEDENISCERRQLCYSSLGNMFYVPLRTWLSDQETKTSMKARAVNILSEPDVGCGQVSVLKLYKGVMAAYKPRLYGAPEDWEFNHDDYVRVNESFRGFSDELDTAEERLRALDLLLMEGGVGQPDFLMFYKDHEEYYEFLADLHEDWASTTTFEGTDVDREDFDSLLRLFNNSLGNWDILNKYFTEQDE